MRKPILISVALALILVPAVATAQDEPVAEGAEQPEDVTTYVGDAPPDTYSVSVATVAFDGPLEPANFLGYEAFVVDDASDGTGPLVGRPVTLYGPGGTALYESLVSVTATEWGGFELNATLSAITGDLFSTIPRSAMSIAGDGGPWDANAFNYTVGNVLAFPDIERDGIDIGTEWVFVDGQVSLTGGAEDWSIDHVQFFHPSDIEGAILSDVHLGYNLDPGLLESTGATSMTITVEVAE